MRFDKHKIRLLASLAGLVLVIIFILQNTEVVTVRFLFWNIAMSRVIFILILVAIGFLSGYGFCRFWKRNR